MLFNQNVALKVILQYLNISNNDVIKAINTRIEFRIVMGVIAYQIV